VNRRWAKLGWCDRIGGNCVGTWSISKGFCELYERIRSREGEAGRPAADPAVLLALWLYATVDGIGSARELERLAQSDAAYRWLAAGVPVNYHGLADFRIEPVEVLDRPLTQSVTALIGEGLISLAEIAVEGAKIRASASKTSFKTGETLLKIEAAITERLEALKQELTGDPGASNRRAKRRASGLGETFGSAPEERGRRSNGLRRSARRAQSGTPRTRPRRRSPRFRRPIPRRVACASPTAQFVPPTTPRLRRRRKRASSFRLT
jgi:transposase